MSELIILIDCDGVLANFQSMAEDLVNEFIGFVPKWDEEWDMFLHPDVREHKSALFSEITKRPGCIRNLAKHEFADRMVDELRGLGKLIACTSVLGGHYPSERFAWLNEELGFKREDIILAHRKELVYGDVFIDDKPENILNWKEKHPKGLACLWQPPKKKTKVPDNVFSTGNILELLTKIKGKYGV